LTDQYSETVASFGKEGRGVTDKFVPIYRRIADDLAEAIATGRHPVGTNLPTEHQLADGFKVSRATIVAALNHVESLGLIYRKPRVGTQVISRYPARSEIEGTVFHDWTRFGIEYIFVVDKLERSDLPERAGVERSVPRRNWLHVIGRRVKPRSSLPICHVNLYINPQFDAIEDEITERPPRIFSLIEARYGIVISVVDQELRGARLSAEQAKPLLCKAGDPAIEIIRWYRGPKNKLIEFTIDTHPGEKFSYKTRTFRGEN
jgi:DNA-binding GntR family transcriptional regulator